MNPVRPDGSQHNLTTSITTLGAHQAPPKESCNLYYVTISLVIVTRPAFPTCCCDSMPADGTPVNKAIIALPAVRCPIRTLIPFFIISLWGIPSLAS